jgi:hypothetical protein
MKGARPMRLTARNLAVLATTAAVSSALLLDAVAPAARAYVPKNAAWTSSAPFGIWNDGNFDLYNNEWNTAQAGPQTIWAYSYKHWGVQSTQADTRSVKSYPSVQENLNYPRVSSLGVLWSRFRQSMPTVRHFDEFDAEAAYDLWLMDGKNQIEFMVWVDDHGQRPAGSPVTAVTFYGRRYRLWVSGRTLFTFRLLGRQATSGSVHLLTMIDWLMQHRYLNRKDTLWQVNFGWEICSTDRVPMNFTVTNYSLTLRK